MKRLFKLLIWLIVLSPFLLLGAVVLSIEERAVVAGDFVLSPAQIRRAKELAKQHDPRKAKEGEIKSVRLSEEELNLLAAYVVDMVGGSALVQLQDGSLDLIASFKLPQTPLGSYINLRLGLVEAAVLPRIRHLQVGKISVPKGLADFALEKSLDRLYSQPGYEVAEDVVQKVEFAPRDVQLTYQWHSEITDVVRSTLITGADQARLRDFQNELADVVNAMGPRASLQELMVPLFDYARRRARGGDPVEDNRAALVVMAAYVNNKNLNKLAPDVDTWKQTKRVSIRSYGRDDLPKHYLTSASLAVTGGSVLSQAIGLFKEVDDSQGGSGFSFTDLLADNAGTRLGELAVESRSSASKVQDRLAAGVREADLIPSLDGLQDGLSEHEFKRRYGEVGSPAYEKVVDVIAQRIEGTALYQD